MRHTHWFAFVVLLCSTAFAAKSDAPSATSAPTHTFVIVHGAWGGGWAFKEVERLLRADGHLVYRPTLTGLGEKVHLAHANIDLTTHITDVANAILWENLKDVILVGHSYGGMVISGVMERVPDRIKHAIYLDAIVPNDGESVQAAFDNHHPLLKNAENDFILPPWVKPDDPVPHDVPHPGKTFREPIFLKNPAAKTLPTTYILTIDPGKAPTEDTFFRFYERAKNRGWSLKEMETDHNPQRSKPEELVTLLETTAQTEIQRKAH